MISVSEKISLLKKQEQALHRSLENLRGQKSLVKEHRQLDKELSGLVHQRQNLESIARFEVGMPVHRFDSKALGRVSQLTVTPGGMGVVWVSWNGTIEIPEQPNMLQIDGAALAEMISVGDRIEICDGHEEGGKTFTVERLLARGAVETTVITEPGRSDEMVFEREDWQKIEGVFQGTVETANEEDEDSIHSDSFIQGNPMVTHLAEELNDKTSETIFTVVATTIEELTQDEEKERHRLESKVERAFYEAGSALRQLRDGRLYRSTHKTFEEYVK